MNSQYPCRIELKTKSNIVCSFTVNIDLNVEPHISDYLVFNSEIMTKVSNFCHYLESDISIILTDPIILEDETRLFKVLDIIKSKYEIYDIKANKDPDSYYTFYRTVITVLGLSKDPDKVIECDPLLMKAIAEVSRSIIIATMLTELTDRSIIDNIKNYNNEIKDLHMIMIENKACNQGRLDLLSAFREWDKIINSGRTILWNLEIDIIKRVAHTVFKQFKSIPQDFINHMVN